MTSSPFDTNSSSSPVLIVSPPRSGSSLTAAILQAGGLFGGKMKPGDRWNVRGYFENIAIANLETQYLQHADRLGLQKRYQPRHLDQPSPDFGLRVRAVMREEGPDSRWFYKSTKAPILWRLWDNHFPDARWVLVCRNRIDQLRSLQRTKFMDAFATQADWIKFLRRYDEWYCDILKFCRHTFLFHIDLIFADDIHERELLFRWLDLDPFDAEAIALSRELWNGP